MKRKFIIISIFFLTLCSTLSKTSQSQINIRGCIKGLPYSKVYLAEVYAGRAKLIDSVQANNDCFDFHPADTLHEGLYYIILNKERTAFVQLILNKGDVVFHSVFSTLPDSMVIEQSSENQILYKYIKQIATNTKQITAIGQSVMADKTMVNNS